jgi:hypothetical protein
MNLHLGFGVQGANDVVSGGETASQSEPHEQSRSQFWAYPHERRPHMSANLRERTLAVLRRLARLDSL